jgi:hypothetical protein
LRKELAIHIVRRPIKYRPSTGYEYAEERREVRVMVRAEGYAMVRRKGCMPYVVPEKELQPAKEQA